MQLAVLQNQVSQEPGARSKEQGARSKEPHNKIPAPSGPTEEPCRDSVPAVVGLCGGCCHGGKPQSRWG